MAVPEQRLLYKSCQGVCSLTFLGSCEPDLPVCLTPFPFLFATSSSPLQPLLLGAAWVMQTEENWGCGSNCTAEPVPAGTEGAQGSALRPPVAATVFVDGGGVDNKPKISPLLTTSRACVSE